MKMKINWKEPKDSVLLNYEKVPQKEVNSGIIFLKKNKNYSQQCQLYNKCKKYFDNQRYK